MFTNARLRVEKGVIRTFNARRGRISQKQIQVLEQYFPEYEMPDSKWDFNKLFGDKEIIYEIGCGAGDTTIALAKNNPEKIVIAVEVHRPSITQLIEKIKNEKLENIRLAFSDAVQILKERVPDNSLAEIHAYFPDPWPKKRHHKRRLFRKELIDLMLIKLQKGGVIHTATDWQEYAEEMLENLPNAQKINQPSWRPLTKYEKKGLNANRVITEITAKKM
jgi:tRNA (guanine-N7-)-methyltransferase